jgi:hypothetical protein
VAGRINFTDAVMDRGPRGDLPMTVDLLAMLGTDDFPPIVPTPPEPGPPPPASAADAQLTRAQAVIEAELTEYLGPMAVVICREHIARAAAAGPPHDVRQIVEALAREIGDRAKEERFRQQVLARLRER